MPEDCHRFSLRRLARARRIVLLAAVAPFLPGACEIARRGVPDRILTSDRAILELRTLNAARGAQLVGPYSRFAWSQPGPAYFYLALPFYEATHKRGPALSLFAFTVNLVSAVALVLSARKLKGDAFALIVAVMLAVYGTGAPRFHLGEMWNPILPVVPLGLLFFLAVRLGLGDLRVLPAMAFLGSCIVQTHLAYAPIALMVGATGALLFIRRRVEQKRSHSTSTERPAHPLAIWIATFGLLVLLWAAPIYQDLTAQPGNLRALADFFVTPSPARQSWSSVMELVAQYLAVAPLTFTRLLHPSPTLTTALVAILIALVLVLALVVVLASTRKRDPVSTTMATLTLVGVAASIFAVREVRGPILPYFVMWISIVGLFGVATIAGAVLPWFESRARRRPVAVALTICALCLALSVRAQAKDSVFPERDVDAEIMIPGVRQFLQARHVDKPILVITNRPHPWPVATAVALDLYKHGVPFLVDEEWRFMMGHQFELDGSRHPHLYVGDGAFDRYASTRPDFVRVAGASDSCAYLEDPEYLRAHRSPSPAVLVGAAGTGGDPRITVDGFIPIESTAWDGPWSVVLQSESSFIEVAVPKRPLVGIYMSVAGDDGYVVGCLRPDGSASVLGATSLDERESGMRTRLVFSDLINTCTNVRVRAWERDGRHSLGEVGFLEK